MTLFEVLIEDHRKVAKLLEESNETTERALKTRQELLGKIKKELDLHTTIEEKFLYPLLKDFEETKDLTLESYQEHHVVKMLISELEKTPPESETWGAKLTVLKENVEHHVKEEEGSLFPKAKKVLTKDQIDRIGNVMLEFKRTGG